MARRYKGSGMGAAGIFVAIIVGLASVLIVGYVGNEVLTDVGASVNVTGGPFEQGFNLIGLSDTSTWESTGLVAILGLAAFAGVILFYFRRAFKGMR